MCGASSGGHHAEELRDATRASLPFQSLAPFRVSFGHGTSQGSGVKTLVLHLALPRCKLGVNLGKSLKCLY